MRTATLKIRNEDADLDYINLSAASDQQGGDGGDQGE